MFINNSFCSFLIFTVAWGLAEVLLCFWICPGHGRLSLISLVDLMVWSLIASLTGYAAQMNDDLEATTKQKKHTWYRN
jgi:hypothetical protein